MKHEVLTRGIIEGRPYRVEYEEYRNKLGLLKTRGRVLVEKTAGDSERGVVFWHPLAYVAMEAWKAAAERAACMDLPYEKGDINGFLRLYAAEMMKDFHNDPFIEWKMKENGAQYLECACGGGNVRMDIWREENAAGEYTTRLKATVDGESYACEGSGVDEAAYQEAAKIMLENNAARSGLLGEEGGQRLTAEKAVLEVIGVLAERGWRESGTKGYREGWKRDEAENSFSREVLNGGKAVIITVSEGAGGPDGHAARVEVDFGNEIGRSLMEGGVTPEQAREAVDAQADSLSQKAGENCTAQELADEIGDEASGRYGAGPREMSCVRHVFLKDKPLYGILSITGHAREKTVIHRDESGFETYMFDYINGRGKITRVLEREREGGSDSWHFQKPFNKASALEFIRRFEEGSFAAGRRMPPAAAFWDGREAPAGRAG